MLVPRFAEVLRRNKLLLRGWQLGAEGARRLALDPCLAEVSVLDLTGNRITDAGLLALLESPRLGRVGELRLAENDLTASGLGALASSPLAAGLTELALGRNSLGPAGIEVLAPLVPRLDILELDQNPLGDAGAEALARAGHRSEELSLGFTGLGPRGLAALVDARALANTHGLQLGGNPLGDEGAEVLARLASQTTGFSSVDLGWTGIGARGLERLLDSGVFRKGIGHLALRGNPLGEAGLRMLAEHPGLPDATLHLDDGPSSVIAAIRARTRVIVATPLDPGYLLACPYCYEALSLDQPLCPHCDLDATRDAPTEEPVERHQAAARRPCPHCRAPMHARSAARCPSCASWAVSAEDAERFAAV